MPGRRQGPMPGPGPSLGLGPGQAWASARARPGPWPGRGSEARPSRASGRDGGLGVGLGLGLRPSPRRGAGSEGSSAFRQPPTGVPLEVPPHQSSPAKRNAHKVIPRDPPVGGSVPTAGATLSCALPRGTVHKAKDPKHHKLHTTFPQSAGALRSCSDRHRGTVHKAKDPKHHRLHTTFPQ